VVDQVLVVVDLLLDLRNRRVQAKRPA